jgi:hypothetical protein
VSVRLIEFGSTELLREFSFPSHKPSDKLDSSYPRGRAESSGEPVLGALSPRIESTSGRTGAPIIFSIEDDEYRVQE